MILIIGSDEDPTSNYFCNFLKDHGTRYVFLNQKFLLRGIEISSEYITVFDNKYKWSEFSGALNRLSSPDIKDLQNMPQKYLQCIKVLNSTVDDKIQNTLNPCFVGISNDSKLLQLAKINVNCIKKPSHLVLANKKVTLALKNFSSNKRHVIKSLSSIRSIAMEFNGNEKIFLEKSKEPVLFQELIDGINLRVHVIDDVCVPVRIVSEVLDYRYDTTGERYFEACEIPAEIGKDCVSISRQLGLRFSGIDLIQKRQEYYLLEANPGPGWSYFEESIEHKKMSYRLMEVLNGNTKV